MNESSFLEKKVIELIALVFREEEEEKSWKRIQIKMKTIISLLAPFPLFFTLFSENKFTRKT